METEMFWTVVRANAFCYLAATLIYILGHSALVHIRKVRHERLMKHMEEEHLGEQYVLGPHEPVGQIPVLPHQAVVEAVPPLVATCLYLEGIAESEPDLADVAKALMHDLEGRMTARQIELLNNLRSQRPTSP